MVLADVGGRQVGILVQTRLASSCSHRRARAILLVVLLSGAAHLIVVICGRYRDIVAIIERTLVVVHRTSFAGAVGLVHRVRVLLLQGHVVLLPWEPLWGRILAVRAHLLVVLGSLVGIVGLLLESGPALLADERIAVLLVLLRVIFEESG